MNILFIQLQPINSDLIIASVTLLTLVIQFFSLKRKEAAQRNIDNKRNAYFELLQIITESSLSHKHEKLELNNLEDDKRNARAINLLLLYADDKVLKLYNQWIKIGDENSAKEIFLKLLGAIRKDIHKKSNLPINQIDEIALLYSQKD